MVKLVSWSQNFPRNCPERSAGNLDGPSNRTQAISKKNHGIV